MAKQNWKSIDLLDIKGGMATNPVDPGNKFAKRLLNVYPHEKPGALVLRKGYAPKYMPPADDTITSSEYLNFGVFFDRQADPNGKEIICLIQKGIVNALKDEHGEVITPETMQGFWFWSRPYWDGVQWLNNWQWVNRTIITKITETDDGYSTHFKIFGSAQHQIFDDTLIGWTVYNLTQGQLSKIITNKIESTSTWINIALVNSDWDTGDVLIISRCWLDIEAHLEFYNNVKKEDIVFHRINNDLRIGFGGKENRPGLMFGYRKSFRLIDKIDFTNPHINLLENDAILNYSKTDGMILEPHILGDQYGIQIIKSGGTLTAAKYYFRLTGIIDGYQEQYIADANVEVNGSENITIRPYIQSGYESRRVTKLRVYAGTDNITFYKLSEYIISQDTWEQPNLVLEDDGRLFAPAVKFQDAGEYHTNSNAMSLTNESDSAGLWLNLEYGNAGLESVSDFIFAGGMVVTPQDGSYLLRWYLKPPKTGILTIISPHISYAVRKLNIQFKIIAQYAATIRISTYNSSDYVDVDVPRQIWAQVDVDLTVDQRILITTVGDQPVLQAFGLDKMTITNPEVNEIIYGADMSLELGYEPTKNLVKGWDQAIISRGRAYYLNPYVEKRYENFLLVSHIHSNNSFMWDIASFGNFRELDKKDSNKAIAIELLPNNEILILKDSSITTLADDGLIGITREPVYGIDCISRGSVVNINGLVFWCGKEEIYILNIGRSLIPEPMLKNTIRDLYLAITDKDKIFGTRNRFNTFRIRVNDSQQKAEYLLTEDGWVEERKWHYPEIYRGGYSNKLYFLNNGSIYEEEVDYSLPAVQYGEDTAE